MSALPSFRLPSFNRTTGTALPVLPTLPSLTKATTATATPTPGKSVSPLDLGPISIINPEGFNTKKKSRGRNLQEPELDFNLYQQVLGDKYEIFYNLVTNSELLRENITQNVALDLVDMILHEDPEKITKLVAEAKTLDDIIWKQEAMRDAQKRVDREVMVKDFGETGIKGVGKCRYCSSKELVFSTKQIGGGDEATTIFVRCVLCNRTWRG